jgi:acetyl esterase/lipase
MTYTKQAHLSKLIRLVFIFFITSVFSQGYVKETIKLYGKDSIPFNKENITLKETLDEVGIRYSKISEPVIYVYKKKNRKQNGAALLFCPGGGYSKVSIGKNDGEGLAKHFLKMGFNVVAVLKYRLPDKRIVNSQEKVPLCDAQKAMSILHKKASDWSVCENKIAVMGGSAGGHLAGSLANLKEPIIAPGVESKDLTHAVSILMYPVITFNLPYRNKGSFKNLLRDQSNNQSLLDYYSLENQVSENTPPTFIVHAKDDVGVVYQNSLMYVDSLKKHDVNYKYVELEKGGHGFGLNSKKTGVDWTIALEKWLHMQTDIFTN